MIYIYTTAAHGYTVNGIRATNHPVHKSILHIPYESLMQAGSSHVSGEGVHIFTDIERLPNFFIPKLISYRHQLEEYYGDRVLFLNHPTRSNRRYRLLKKLFIEGLNKFNVYRLNEYPNPAQWPVFVRPENEHISEISPLLENQEQLDAYRRKLHADETYTDDMVVIEFLDTSDQEGVFRKYSVMRIGDELLPRHLFFSSNWILKNKDLVGPEQQEEESAFLKEFPHRDEIQRIFDLAEIDYGRIDYSLHDGRVQTWEINTNPFIHVHGDDLDPDDIRVANQEKFLGDMHSAFRTLEAKCSR